MLENIDTQKSIAQNKIHFNNRGFFDIIMMIITYLAFVVTPPIFAVRYAFLQYNDVSNDKLISILILLVLLTISLFFFYKLYSRKILFRITNVDKNLIFEAIAALEWDIIASNQTYLIVKPNTWQKQISILFDKKDILVHSLRFGKYDFYFRETSKLNLLLSKIKEIQNKNKNLK